MLQVGRSLVGRRRRNPLPDASNDLPPRTTQIGVFSFSSTAPQMEPAAAPWPIRGHHGGSIPGGKKVPKITRYLFWNSHQVIVKTFWLLVIIGSGYGLVPPGNKPLPEPLLSKISVAKTMQTRTTRTPAFWGYPTLPHDYPNYWFILDPKSKQSQSYKFKKFAKTSTFLILKHLYATHLPKFSNRCINMKWI